jgi:glutamate-1-semialdehyde 2,1-aminomutase
MDRVAPDGDVYQAGTLSGNPLAVRAGIAMLRALRAPGVYDRLEASAGKLERGFAEAFAASSVKTSINRVGSLMTIFFTDRAPVDFATAAASDTKLFASFFRKMLERGVYLAPSQFEALFVSLAHTDALIDRTIASARDALASMRGAPGA